MISNNNIFIKIKNLNYFSIIIESEKYYKNYIENKIIMILNNISFKYLSRFHHNHLHLMIYYKYYFPPFFAIL